MHEVMTEIDGALDRVDVGVDDDGGAMKRHRAVGRLFHLVGHDGRSFELANSAVMPALAAKPK